MDALPIIGAIIGAIIGLAVMWAIIRSAVKHALRDHQEWIDAGKPPSQSDFRGPTKPAD